MKFLGHTVLASHLCHVECTRSFEILSVAAARGRIKMHAGDRLQLQKSSSAATGRQNKVYLANLEPGFGMPAHLDT